MQSFFTFQPIYKERPWGGRKIANVGAGRSLPPHQKIGESWEISDREGAESVIADGPFQGRSIRWLLDEHGSWVMGTDWPKGRRFPLLIKLLDAAERLSLQVHPPASVATQLHGEPKTEMWYLLDADRRAAVLAGLKRGVRREDFERAFKDQALEPLIHRLPVQKGDSIFIPSGRIHAIDAGCLILEIQQNSDTTYRVYDWERVGLDGKPRELHVPQSLRCIDFQDFEPSLSSARTIGGMRLLAENEYFRVEHRKLKDAAFPWQGVGAFHVLKGAVEVGTHKTASRVPFHQGQTALLAGGIPHAMRAADAELILISNF